MKKNTTFFNQEQNYLKNITKKIILCMVSVFLIISIMSTTEEVYAASSTHLKKSSIVLTLGETYSQKLISSKGKTIESKSVTWKSKNKDIATISKSGKITSKKAGTVDMVAKYKNKTYKFTVKVKEAKLNNTKKTIYVGRKTTLKLYDANNKKIDVSKLSFKSSDKSIATVTKKGVVLGKKSGKVIITVSYKSKSYKATITVKSNISIEKTSITMKDNQTKKVLISTTKYLEDITYDIVKGDNLVDCSWSSWNGDEIYLKVKAISSGTAKIKIYNTKNKSDYKYITIKIKGTGSHLDIMAACGINEAYNSAKYPSTLHINSITYANGKINGYGETIDRMVLRCYAANSFGGYGDIYIVVLRCDSSDDYSDWDYYPGYGYISTSSYSANPGLENTLYDNQTALAAYQKFYNTDKVIPYD